MFDWGNFVGCKLVAFSHDGFIVQLPTGGCVSYSYVKDTNTAAGVAFVTTKLFLAQFELDKRPEITLVKTQLSTEGLCEGLWVDFYSECGRIASIYFHASSDTGEPVGAVVCLCNDDTGVCWDMVEY